MLWAVLSYFEGGKSVRYIADMLGVCLNNHNTTGRNVMRSVRRLSGITKQILIDTVTQILLPPDDMHLLFGNVFSMNRALCIYFSGTP